MTQEDIQNFVSSGIADITRLQKRIADVAETLRQVDAGVLLTVANGVGGDPVSEMEQVGRPLLDGVEALTSLSTELLHSVSVTTAFILGVRAQRDKTQEVGS